MSVTVLLTRLQRLNITVQLQDAQLKVSWPEGKLDTTLLAEIKENKEDIISFLKGISKERYQSIGRVADRQDYGLSHGQKRLWMLDRLSPGMTAYNIPLAYRLEGSLRVEVLEGAFRRVVGRHESLRTVFGEVGGEPRQRVLSLEKSGFRLEYLDLRGEGEGWQLAMDRAMRAAERPFDLEQGPLLRVELLRVEEEVYCLWFMIHHIISDEWSMEVLIREVISCYNAGVKGLPDPLAALPIQYRDYAHWQDEELKGGAMEAQRKYWLEQLAGDLPVLELPADRIRPAVQRYRGGGVGRQFNIALSQRLEEIAREQGMTLFMVLLAGLDVLLYRYTGQEDVLVGTPVAGREHAELADQIGFFANTLVMRTRLKGEWSFMELLAEAKEVSLSAYEHQGYPFDRLVEELGVVRGLSRPPIFDVLLVVENTLEEKDTAMVGGKIIGLDLAAATSKFDLTFFFSTNAKGLYLSIEYNTDLFDSERIERLGEHFERLLAGLVGDPGTMLRAVEYVGEAERDLLLRNFNRTETQQTADETLIGLFEHQAAMNKERVAIMSGSRELTYGELNEASNRLAHYLIANCTGGNGGEVIVGVMIERSFEMIIAILATLKAGYAYLPIDTEYPSERIRYLLDNSEAGFLITDARLADKYKDNRNIIIEEVLERSELPTYDPAVSIDRDHLLYVLYTSGSTGLPKGVMIEAAGFVNLLNWYIRTVGFSTKDKNLLIAPISFDLAQKNIFASLLSGGILVLSAPRYDVTQIIEEIDSRGITVINCAPAAFYPLLQHSAGENGPYSKLSSLKSVVLGGEPINLEIISRLLESTSFSGAVFNTYGPTECTDVVCFYKLDVHNYSFYDTVPIGIPVDNVKLFVLDQFMEPVPFGNTGELCIGGIALGRGYWKNDELTSEKFVSTPGLPVPRVYKTGDLVKMLPDWNLAYIGRKDSQVKIRGYRVEPGEVETNLLRYPGLREAVVIPFTEEDGNQCLAAYYTSGWTLPAKELREFLRQYLPNYFIPTYFEQIERLPLNANGKVDRKKLPVPKFELKPGQRRPQTSLEKQLAGIWEEVLDIEGVGLDDNFFELGGHSLRATELVAKIQRICSVKIELGNIFSRPVLKEQAEYIDSIRQRSIQYIPRIKDQPDYPMSYFQKKMWIAHRLQTGLIAYNIPLAYRLEGQVKVEKLAEAFDRVVGRHQILRTVFREVGGEPRQRVLSVEASGFRLEYTDLRGEADARQRAMDLAVQEAARPFDLEHGPLLRAEVLRIEEEVYYLLFMIHHIVSDRWSIQNLTSEIFQIYNALLESKGDPLARLSIQYRDYVHWQEEQLKGGVMEGHRKYWLEQLGGELPVLELPTDRVRPAARSYRGDWVGRRLNAALSGRLKELAQEQGMTLFMVLLAGLDVLLYRYTGQEDLLVGTPVAGREHTELEGQIGCYLNTVVIRTRLKGEWSFRELLAEVKKASLSAYDHQGYPFDRLVEELVHVRDLSRSPLFDVVLELENSREEKALVMAGGRVAGMPITLGTSKFDLTFFFSADPEGLDLSIEYNTDLFDRERIERMGEHFERLLSGLVGDAGRMVGTVEYVGEMERELLLRKFNGRGVRRTMGETLVGLFERQVIRHREEIAVVSGERTLTYGELNRRANRLGHYLREELGVKVDDRVGLMVGRNEWMLVGMLGILKSGGAYLPVDAEHPRERVEWMLADGGVRVVVTDRRVGYDWADYDGRVVRIDGEVMEGEGKEEDLAGVNGEGDLAYVMYTSGSSGRPKGVMISHGSVVNYLSWANRYYFNGEAGACFGVLTSYGFDLTVTGTFSGLLRGGKVNILEGQDIGRLLEEAVSKEEITVLKLTPSHLNMLGNMEGLRGMRTGQVIVGGEALTEKQVEVLRRLNGGVRIYNEYGPTETTVGCTVEEIRKGEGIGIGGPIDNAEVYVVDGYLGLQGIGIAGEICIGGAGVARGYLKQEELTGERFVPNPYRTEEQREAGINGRIYRTGDMGRWREDGRLEYLGRRDFQVKVRGYRIELGEIESRLQRHEEIESAVVVLKELRSGEKELVAYVVSRSEVEGPVLRQYLGRYMPGYMVPGYYVRMEKLPLTANGKIDRKQLPEPEGMREGSRRMPGTPLERQLAEIWESVLGLEAIGLEDDFFELGGHSLKAIQAVSRINSQLKLDITLRNFLQYPTIKGFIEALVPEKLKKGLILALNKIGKNKPVIYFMPSVIGTSVGYMDIAKLLEPEFSCYGLQNTGFDHEEAFDASVEMTARRFADEIEELRPAREIILCGYSSAALTAFELAKIMEERQYTAKLILLDHATRQTTGSDANKEEFKKDFDQWISGPLKERGFEPERIERIGNLWYNNVCIAFQYEIHGMIDGDIICFEGDGHAKEEYFDMRRWARYTRGNLYHFYVSGGHDDILSPNNLKTMAQGIIESLSSPRPNKLHHPITI